MVWIHVVLTALSAGCVAAMIWIKHRIDVEVKGLLNEVRRLRHKLMESWGVKRDRSDEV